MKVNDVIKLGLLIDRRGVQLEKMDCQVLIQTGKIVIVLVVAVIRDRIVVLVGQMYTLVDKVRIQIQQNIQ